MAKICIKLPFRLAAAGLGGVRLALQHLEGRPFCAVVQMVRLAICLLQCTPATRPQGQLS